MAQDIEFGSAHSNVDSAEHASSDVAETEAGMMIRKELQDSSLAEGAAGLLAMVSSANRTKDLQVELTCSHAYDCAILQLRWSRTAVLYSCSQCLSACPQSCCRHCVYGMAVLAGFPPNTCTHEGHEPTKDCYRLCSQKWHI